ncbi:DUF2851 family protein [Ekhidna sp.]|uniref:DUF2851 family protein n=1 Tax=Ekhidna sp. TaxID=2608089 RepID=UPI0032EE8430
MDEQFLHYIWKHQKFEPGKLKLACGKQMLVFNPGSHNQDSGPDFEEARIKIDNIEWAGQVELHINSSDWFHHRHQNDTAYDNVILHVVWNHDKEVKVNDEPLPTLELKEIINPLLVKKYKSYLHAPDEILCRNQLKDVSSISINNMLDRVLVERLEEKAERILLSLENNYNNWEETTYHVIAGNFGFSTNKDAFERLAKLLPFSSLKKVLQSPSQTEALLFGQAGFLEKETDDYQRSLKSEFTYLIKKFQLSESMMKAQWKFGKLRPANFPTVRLGQLASILSHQPQLFSLLTETESIKELKRKLQTPLSEYWQEHYDFGKARSSKSKAIGEKSFENILINTVAPLLAAYSKYVGDSKYMDRAIELLESIPKENNRITKKWDDPGLSPKTAFDSQALIQLFKSYCQKRKCLQCNIGVEILNK